MAVVAVLLAASAVNAQTTEGTIVTGGSIGFNSSTSKTTTGGTAVKDYKNSSFNILASGGYFIADKTAVGLNIGFSTSKKINYGINNSKSTTTYSPITVGLFAQRYFMFQPQFGLTGSFNALMDFGTSKTENLTNNITTITKSSDSNLNFGFNGGAVWFPTPHIGISANVGILNYYISTTKSKDVKPEVKKKTSGFDFGLSSSTINLGFNYFIF